MRTKERIKTNRPRNRFKLICFVEVCYSSCVSYQWGQLLFFLIFLWYRFSLVPCLIVTFLHSPLFNSFSLSVKLLHCSFHLFSLSFFTYTLIFLCYIHLIHLMAVVVAYFQLVLIGFWARIWSPDFECLFRRQALVTRKASTTQSTWSYLALCHVKLSKYFLIYL